MKRLFEKLLSLVMVVSMSLVSFGAAEYNLSDEIERAQVVTQYDDVEVDKIDTVLFGSYKQNVEYTKEPIEWIVLEKDRINRKALLLSKYILDAGLYDYRDEIDYAHSQLNTFLNEGFIYRAFNEAEMSKIIKLGVGGSTESPFDEKVFLLDVDQMKKYFPYQGPELSLATLASDPLGLKSFAKATAYAKGLGLEVQPELPGLFGKGYGVFYDSVAKGFVDGISISQFYGTSPYWLKSEGFSDRACYAKSASVLYNGDIDGDVKGIRPAIWVTY